jgi:2-polyprenyl-6-methoxyphenol hydroxylase-like FAD-dependent oxidoreductase
VTSASGSSSAVVLGAGIAGLLAARVLARRYGTVTLVDRRPRGDDGWYAQGVPQSDHLHVLLARGQLILERTFPGLLAECAATTGARNDWGATTFWANPFGVHPQHESGVATWQFSRARLDRAIYGRLADIGNLHVRSAHVRGLIGDGPGGRIQGVWLHDDGEDPDARIELRADLVVDARGRSSSLVDELKALGWPAPPISQVDNELGYSSQFFALDDGQRAAWKLVYLQVRPGLVDRGGALCEVEDGKLVATLIGTGAHRPGAGQDELLAFAESLGHSQIADALRRATPLGAPKLWRNLGNRRRHFGRMQAWPRGLVVMGDALCTFNPVYGQGMTVAAVQAEALEQQLARMDDPTTAAWEAGFQRRLERLLFIPWFMSTTEDQRNRRLANPRLHTRILHGYFDLVLRGAVRDRTLHTAFLRIMHMLRSPFSLLSPLAAMRVGWRTVQRAFGPPPSGPDAALSTTPETARFGAPAPMKALGDA